MNCCKMYIALVEIIINFWSFHSAEGLSSIDWINASIDILTDSTNNLVIKTIPNAVCDAMSKTISRDCHEHDTTKLAKWYFSVKCVANCNDNIGLPPSVIQKVEVECVFSKNNTSNMTMDEIGWSAVCLCPKSSKHGGKQYSAEETSFGEMLVEFSRLQCDHAGSLADAASNLFKYSKRGFQNCLQIPSICDLHASCIDSVCICNEGYTGNGEDCLYLCKIPIIERTLAITDTNGNILLHDEDIMEMETAIATCDQLDRPKVNLTCGCGGFDKSTVCHKTTVAPVTTTTTGEAITVQETEATTAEPYQCPYEIYVACVDFECPYGCSGCAGCVEMCNAPADLGQCTYPCQSLGCPYAF